MALTPLPICNIQKAKCAQKPQAWTWMSVAQLSAVAVPRLLADLRPRKNYKAEVCRSQRPGLGSQWPVAWLSLNQPSQVLCLMVPRGLEPRTLRLLAVRSNQLSYET